MSGKEENIIRKIKYSHFNESGNLTATSSGPYQGIPHESIKYGNYIKVKNIHCYQR
jgi:hypothetical protein